MSNKELAVQLYIASLQANMAIVANPHYTGTVKIPEIDTMVENVAELTEKLSRIEDK